MDPGAPPQTAGEACLAIDLLADAHGRVWRKLRARGMRLAFIPTDAVLGGGDRDAMAARLARLVEGAATDAPHGVTLRLALEPDGDGMRAIVAWPGGERSAALRGD